MNEKKEIKKFNKDSEASIIIGDGKKIYLVYGSVETNKKQWVKKQLENNNNKHFSVFEIDGRVKGNINKLLYTKDQNSSLKLFILITYYIVAFLATYLITDDVNISAVFPALIISGYFTLCVLPFFSKMMIPFNSQVNIFYPFWNNKKYAKYVINKHDVIYLHNLNFLGIENDIDAISIVYELFYELDCKTLILEITSDEDVKIDNYNGYYDELINLNVRNNKQTINKDLINNYVKNYNNFKSEQLKIDQKVHAPLFNFLLRAASPKLLKSYLSSSAFSDADIYKFPAWQEKSITVDILMHEIKEQDLAMYNKLTLNASVSISARFKDALFKGEEQLENFQIELLELSKESENEAVTFILNYITIHYPKYF